MALSRNTADRFKVLDLPPVDPMHALIEQQSALNKALVSKIEQIVSVPTPMQQLPSVQYINPVPEKRIVPSKWTFTPERGEDGSVLRITARPSEFAEATGNASAWSFTIQKDENGLMSEIIAERG